MGKFKRMSFKQMRAFVKENNITEEKFYKAFKKLDNGRSCDEILRLITNHIYHSTEEHLYAPPHLRGA